MGLEDRTPPSVEEHRAWRERFRNWGRWGEDDQLGTLNLITPEVRAHAASLVRAGRSISLANPLDTRPGPRNPFPVSHYLRWHRGIAWDYFAINYHGLTNTHIDAHCHIFTGDGDAGDGGGGQRLYNGRPASLVSVTGARSGSVEHWRDGIVTRGVLYDIPRFRGAGHVGYEEPVHGWELEDAARAQGAEPRPGDAVIVRSGAEAVQRAFDRGELEPPGESLSVTVPGAPPRPGVHASALEFLYEHDASILVWDLQEAWGQPYEGNGGAIHQIALPYMGLPLLDNANLEALGEACAELGRYEFQFVCAPLVIRGGTGSPVNPLAVL